MMGEECSLPQDASTAEHRTKRENYVAPHPFATWVRDALEVAYGHVRGSLRKTASHRKRLYDTKAVNQKFPVGSCYDITQRPLNINWVPPESDPTRLFDRPPVIRLASSVAWINQSYLFMSTI